MKKEHKLSYSFHSSQLFIHIEPRFQFRVRQFLSVIYFGIYWMYVKTAILVSISMEYCVRQPHAKELSNLIAARRKLSTDLNRKMVLVNRRSVVS